MVKRKDPKRQPKECQRVENNRNLFNLFNRDAYDVRDVCVHIN